MFLDLGTRGASDDTGGLNFHGRHIFSATLKDLVRKFGIDQAESIVLVGSGSGARGVGYNCDFLADAIATVNPSTDVRCVADAPDFIPWWVKTETDQCENKDYDQLEREKFFWGRADDESCVEQNEDLVNSTELAHKCGVWSRYFTNIDTPFFLIGSQYDPEYFTSAPCAPDEDDPNYEEYVQSWRRGMLALYESALARRSNLGLFVPNCETHTLLEGSLAPSYWSQLKIPLLDSRETVSLQDMFGGWVKSEFRQAIDPLGRVNPGCASPSPQVRRRLLPAGRDGVSLAGAGRRRLLPPSSLFPRGYDRRYNLYGQDPYYGYRGYGGTGRWGPSGALEGQ